MRPLAEYKGLAHLAAVIILLPLLAWRLALADTAGKWLAIRSIENEVAALRSQADYPAPHAAAATGTEHVSDGGLLGEILCGPGCCEVVRYTPYFAPGADGLMLHTAEIVLNTDFLSCVRIMDNIERTMPDSRLRSIMLRSVTPRGSAGPLLHATLVIQQITETNNTAQ